MARALATAIPVEDGARLGHEDRGLKAALGPYNSDGPA